MSDTCTTLSRLDVLRVNPAWASLPLFDRANWTRVRFGDVVQNVNETEKDPAAAGLDRFIGMEHLEPGSLHVTSWGDVVDGTTFTRRCRPGQVLFGKRRAYQRKVAVAEFDAVVSGDIYVLAATNDRLLPELLPFICLSERFFQHAVETSAGSLSPRTNWSSLAGFEFDLPPLAQQHRITEIWWAIEAVVRSAAGLEAALTGVVGALGHHLFGPLSSSAIPLTRLVAQEIADLQTGPFGTVLAASSYASTGIPMINPVHMEQDDFDTAAGPFIGPEDASRLARYRMRAGDIVMCRKRHVGRMVYATPKHEGFIVGSDCIRIRLNEQRILSRFMFFFLRSESIQKWLVASTTGSVMPGMNEATLGRLMVPVPSVEEQRGVIRQLDEVLSSRRLAADHVTLVKRVQSALLTIV